MERTFAVTSLKMSSYISRGLASTRSRLTRKLEQQLIWYACGCEGWEGREGGDINDSTQARDHENYHSSITHSQPV